MNQIIASEMIDSGYKARITKSGVEISLDNRRVNNMEVKEALEQKFEGIRFNLSSAGQGILISS